jgi:hypothetical protein
MDNNSFLNKFKGRTELVGKKGLLGIMNNLHMNIIGSQKPRQLVSKIRKKPHYENDYSYVNSIVKEDFNKNINYMPQFKNKLILQNNTDNQSFSQKNDRPDFNINNEMKNNLNVLINKSQEKPLKLFKFNENKTSLLKKYKNNSTDDINNAQNNLDNNKNFKLPVISQGKVPEKKYLNKKIILKVNNSYSKEKTNSFNNNNIDKNYKRSNSLKENNKELSKQSIKKNKENYYSTRTIKNQKNSNSNFGFYNIVLNGIKDDLNSLKNKINEMHHNNSFVGDHMYKEIARKKNNEFINHKNNDTNLNTYKNNNNYNNFNDNNNNNNTYFNNDNKKRIKKVNINSENNTNNNIIDTKTNNVNSVAFNKINYDLNNNIKINENQRKKILLIPSTNQNKWYNTNIKLEKIDEEDDKYDTNSITNDKNQNFLQIIMKQRLFYQKHKIPDNSRFKLSKI